MSTEPLPLRPKRLSREFRDSPPPSGYGERKRFREAAKLPLLAALPGVLRSAEEYEAEAADAQKLWVHRFRARLAADWLRVLGWRRGASDEERREFARRWQYLPHTPEYALDLIRSIAEQRVMEQEKKGG